MSSIIDALQREGAIVFWRDYRSGTLVDWSIPRGLTGTGTNLQWQGNGRMAFPVFDAMDTTPDQSKLQLTAGAIIVIGDFHRGILGEVLVSKRDGFGENYQFGNSATTIVFRDSSGVTRTIAYTLSGQKCVAVNFKHTETPDAYVDGVLIGALSGAVDAVVDDADLIVGNDYNGNNNTTSNICAAMICNRKLTATEHARIYGELVNFQWPMLPDNHRRAELDTYTQDPNLMGAWDMVPAAGVVTDSSGKGNNASIRVGCTTDRDHFCEHINLDGIAGYIFPGSIGSIKTISMWLRPDTWSEKIFRLQIGGARAAITAGTVQTLDMTGVTIYVNGVVSSTMKARVWQHLAITFDAENANNFDIGYNGVGFFSGRIGPTRVWSTALTAAQVVQEYKRGQAAGYCADWGVYESIADVGAEGQLGGNSPWYVSTGDHRMVNTEINGRPVKAIECINDGIFWTRTDRLGIPQSDAAYGTWEWWQYKTAANFSRAVFSCGTAGWPGYYCDSVADDSYKLYRADGTLLIDGGALTGNAWNHIKITRSVSGNFTLYVNDVLIGSAVDTTDIVSELMGFDIDTGDKICYSDLRGNQSFTKKVLV